MADAYSPEEAQDQSVVAPAEGVTLEEAPVAETPAPEATLSEKEQNPVPSGSVVTEAMVESFVEQSNALYNDKITWTSGLGILLDLEQGKGQWPAFLHDSAFQSLKQAYEKIVQAKQ